MSEIESVPQPCSMISENDKNNTQSRHTIFVDHCMNTEDVFVG